MRRFLALALLSLLALSLPPSYTSAEDAAPAVVAAREKASRHMASRKKPSHPQALSTDYERDRSVIERFTSDIRTEVDAFNSSLPGHVKGLIQRRKARRESRQPS